MDIRIGLAESPRELNIELPDGSDAKAIIKQLEDGIAKSEMVWLTDSKDRQVGIRAERINYVDLGDSAGPRLGFSS